MVFLSHLQKSTTIVQGKQELAENNTIIETLNEDCEDTNYTVKYEYLDSTGNNIIDQCVVTITLQDSAPDIEGWLHIDDGSEFGLLRSTFYSNQNITISSLNIPISINRIGESASQSQIIEYETYDYYYSYIITYNYVDSNNDQIIDECNISFPITFPGVTSIDDWEIVTGYYEGTDIAQKTFTSNTSETAVVGRDSLVINVTKIGEKISPSTLINTTTVDVNSKTYTVQYTYTDIDADGLYHSCKVTISASENDGFSGISENGLTTLGWTIENYDSPSTGAITQISKSFDENGEYELSIGDLAIPITISGLANISKTELDTQNLFRIEYHYTGNSTMYTECRVVIYNTDGEFFTSYPSSDGWLPEDGQTMTQVSSISKTYTENTDPSDVVTVNSNIDLYVCVDKLFSFTNTSGDYVIEYHYNDTYTSCKVIVYHKDGQNLSSPTGWIGNELGWNREEGSMTDVAKISKTFTQNTTETLPINETNLEIVIDKILPIRVTDVSLDRSSVSLEVDSSTQLVATISPDDAANKNITWSSSNTSVATVDNNGVVTALSAGTTTITVSTEDGNKTASCDITVTEPIISVTSVSLNKSSSTLEVGETETLTATINPNNATNKTISWSSSNTSVASVDNNGVVTALSAGTTTITVTTVDGNKTASCNITVTAPIDTPPETVPVTSISLNQNESTLEIGSNLSLSATINPDNATNKTITWSSSNTSVATVDNNGVVTAVSVGTTIITVSTEDGNKTASCLITVTSSQGNQNGNGDGTDDNDTSGNNISNNGSNNTNGNITTTTESTTSSTPSKLPQTGLQKGITLAIIILLILGIVSFVQYRKFREF